MLKSALKNYLKTPKTIRGFTLLEVLVALLILAIAMTAIIRTTIEDTHVATYLQDKTAAHMVAKQALEEYLITYNPHTDGKAEGKLTMLNQTWYWQLQTEASKIPHVKMLTIQVKKVFEPNILAELTTFIGEGYA